MSVKFNELHLHYIIAFEFIRLRITEQLHHKIAFTLLAWWTLRVFCILLLFGVGETDEESKAGGHCFFEKRGVGGRGREGVCRELVGEG